LFIFGSIFDVKNLYLFKHFLNTKPLIITQKLLIGIHSFRIFVKLFPPNLLS
jgi:hypothetical protein